MAALPHTTRSCAAPQPPRPESSPATPTPGTQSPRAPQTRAPRQAPNPQASEGWRPSRGPPTWPPIAALASRPHPGASPYLGGRHGGAATAALAQASLARRPPGGWSQLLFLRVWRRRLPPVRSSLRPPTRTLTPDPSGGKRAVIQNHCSFIGSDGGHSLSGPPRASRQNACGACPASP